MGDRTNAWITIVDCPLEEVSTVLGLLDEYGLAYSWGEAGGPFEQLEIGHMYCDNEISCGFSDDITRELIQHAPGASFEAVEEPYADWLGSINRYTPALDRWGAECDANGEPQWSSDQVLRLFDGGMDRATLRHTLGYVHADALEARSEKNADVILKPLERES